MLPSKCSLSIRASASVVASLRTCQIFPLCSQGQPAARPPLAELSDAATDGRGSTPQGMYKVESRDLLQFLEAYIVSP